MPRDQIPPWGRTLLHGEAGKPTLAVGVASPKGVPWRGGGVTFGRRAAATGGAAAHSGRVFDGGRGNLRAFGRRTAGGSGRWRGNLRAFGAGRRAEAGVGGATYGRSGGAQRAEAGAGGVTFGRSGGKKAGKRRGWRALGAEKPPF